MPLTIIKSGLLLAAAGVQVSSTTQAQLDAYQTRLANGGATLQSTNSGAIAGTIAQWTALQQTDSLPFDSYASFLLQHPGWPGESGCRRAAERQAATAPPASVVAFFRRFPPQSATGTVAYARALQATGQTALANEQARTAWRMGSLPSADESTVLTYFPAALSPADQDARMDALLWQGATASAARQIALVSPGSRASFEARLAFRTNAPDAADLAATTQATYANDPGYIADRATWLRQTNQAAAARDWLARPRTLANRPGDPAAWYAVLLTNANGAAADGRWQTAYDIARQVDDAYPDGTDVSNRSYQERDAYTDLVWLAGQAALTQLHRPADAMTLFDRYARGSRSAQVRSKGYYWAARAAIAAGRTPDANAFLAQAASYRDQFYGQLATEKLGRPLTPPPPLPTPTVDPATRAAFDSREIVQAATFLGGIGDWRDQTPFIRQIASDATTDTDHYLAAELSRRLSRPDLAVMVGRSALQNGLGDYSIAGYPVVPVPAGYEDNWSLIHAIARQESQFDRNAVSHAGARGLMQLMPATAREQAGKMGLDYSPERLTGDPGLSIQIGSSYFQRVFAGYGSYPLAIAAYNAGGGNVNRWLAANGDPRQGQIDMVEWIERIPYSETRNYVQRVLENAVVYDLLNPARAKSRGPNRLDWYLGRNPNS